MKRKCQMNNLDSKLSGFAVDKVNGLLSVPLVVNDNIVKKKHLCIKGLHLNQSGKARMTMNYIAASSYELYRCSKEAMKSCGLSKKTPSTKIA